MNGDRSKPWASDILLSDCERQADLWAFSIVYVLLTLDLTQTMFTTYLVWTILVSGWGNPASIASVNWSISTIPIMTGISTSYPTPPTHVLICSLAILCPGSLCTRTVLLCMVR